MNLRWPNFEIVQQSRDKIAWGGTLRGFQKVYKIGIYWSLDGACDRPYVWLVNPTLKPRDEGTFEDIPHLMFDNENPEHSGLCLFDPDGKEWTSNLLIADTTVPWTADWLRYYEFWHFDGIWRGGGVVPRTTAETRAQAIHKTA